MMSYLPMAGEAGAALFQVVTQRYLKGSVALTTNLGVGKAHRFGQTCAKWHLKLTGWERRRPRPLYEHQPELEGVRGRRSRPGS